MEPKMSPQTTFQSSSPSSSSPSTPCSSSSSSSPSSSPVDGARIELLPTLSPNRNESRLAGNWVPMVAGIATERLRFIDRMAQSGTEWKHVEERFDRLVSTTTAGPVPVVNRSDFAFCIGMEDTAEFAEKLLEALQRRSSNIDNLQLEITKAQLHDYWCRINDPSFNSRIRIFFDLCDKNMDGKITELEIKEVILLSASTNKLSMTQEEAEDYSTLIMEELDLSKRGFIELSQLERLFFKESQRIVSSQSNSEDPNRANRTRTPWINEEVYLRTYWRRAWIVGLWLTICITLFTWKFIQYQHRKAFQCTGYCLSTAKGAAETLKFNMALILLPVCRNTMTWLRMNRRINSVVPFNDNINFHKLIAGGIVVGVILHGGAHLACDFPRIISCNPSIFRRTIAGDFGYHQPSYVEILGTTEAITGITMVVLMAIAFTLATPLPRRRPSSLPWPLHRVTGFNMFWYSHHLFIIVYVLLLVHSIFLFLTHDAREKTTWMYIAFPVLLYLWERIFRAIRSGLYNVEILEANTYPSQVLSLKLSKPGDFNYKSGMYIFIQCPQISPFEWHPFSLTSAPEDNYLNVHIRTQGDWSYQMYSLFQEALASVGSEFPKIYIDGPYGAASQDHVKYDVIILVGLGIGATPFISILKDVVHGLSKPYIDYGDGGESGIKNRKGPSKAYLYWVTREQSSFDWFRDIIKEVSFANRKQAVIEMHNFLTSVYEDGDARSALISAIQALYHTKNGIDIVSRTPVRTHFARPNWTKVFSNLASTHEGARIGVFYCGHSALARELERLCTNLTTKTTTRFVFHKENY
ncbi:respiratory burst oxidase homolog protein A-like [Macadamia integrifolia]|uniref:respiratory burst oxidase homolog protein A-like n=1 Tax=Macadamia integrifolia TaxID=60698 RepID=UPI001C4F4D0E|nr:respiratory burst oxidase homolog protein A-like [Macadamia integrifolia]